MAEKYKKFFCKDCGFPSAYHIQTWLEELANHLPDFSLFKKIKYFSDVLFEKIFTFFKVAFLKENFNLSDIQLRSACFIREARNHGIKFKILRGPFGYTNHILAEAEGRIFRFESLPTADFASKKNLDITNDKQKTKKLLRKKGFPVAEGRSFWFFQKRKAIDFAIDKIGFPLVVKPRNGSVSRHVTTNIKTINQLKEAIQKAIIYSPSFIVEKFIPNTLVYRATVIDFNFTACVKQIPANVVGNGTSTIRKLIDTKNNDPHRGKPNQKEFTLYKIVENEKTRELLKKKGYDFNSIPKKGEIVWLQEDPFLKLGGDLIEVTSQVHSDNLQLFREIARLFDIRVVGIDFLCKEISLPWKKQECAVLELNSLPCIELHHFPSRGKAQNVAKTVVDLFFKYYL